MTEYRRATTPTGTYFFTVNLAERQGNDLLLRQADLLRETTRSMRQRRPFEIVAAVILPDHLHMIWRLPPNYADFATRWSLIKGGFSRALPATERRGASRVGKRERGIWQRRYWEHLICDDEDLRRHVQCIHYNPVKHGYVSSPVEWAHNSFHRYVRDGIYPADWGAGEGIHA